MSIDMIAEAADTPAQPVGAVPRQRTGPDSGYVDWLLTARTRSDVRAAIRRGDIEALADRAYRHLARFWAGAPWLCTPILLHAAAATTHAQSPHRPGRTLGDVAADLVHRKVLSIDTVAARLLAVQRMDLTVAHRHLSGILHAAAAKDLGVDWRALYGVYRGWDHPHPDARRRSRRTLLEQFHTTAH